MQILEQLEEKYGFAYPELYKRLYADGMLDWGQSSPDWFREVYPAIKEKPPLLLLMNDFEVLPVKDIDEMFLEASLKGCIEIGLKAELLAAKKYVDFYVSGFGEGCGSGKLKYSFTKQEFEGGVYLDPIILGVKAKIKSKGVLEFELVDIDKSWSITDKIPLKEGRFKL
jgi:hypothetical protein